MCALAACWNQMLSWNVMPGPLRWDVGVPNDQTSAPTFISLNLLKKELKPRSLPSSTTITTTTMLSPYESLVLAKHFVSIT